MATKTKKTAEKEFLTIREAAEFLGRHYATVRGWVLDGRIPSEKKTAKKKTGVKRRIYYRVRRTELEKAKATLESGLWL